MKQEIVIYRIINSGQSDLISEIELITEIAYHCLGDNFVPILTGENYRKITGYPVYSSINCPNYSRV
jgi:hypothetical protein